jgi:RNA polymerase sigma factor (sigma-70 family)
MPTDRMNGVVRHIRRAAARQEETERTDAEVLADFIDRQDAVAFETLVRRHGPMVLGVCRRILGHAQDAEDAFQAAFLVLARKAATVAPRNLLGNWLYGVAHQTAIRARALGIRRQRRERQVTAMPEPAAATDKGWDDLRPVLDEEVSRLPERYRAVLILCDVQGRTRKDAARHFGCPEGLVSSRLARAREMLARRLSRRGITLSTGILSALVSEHAAASLPPALVGSTISAVGLFTVASVPPAVQALAGGVMKAMAVKTTTATAGFIVLAAAAATGLSVAAHHLQAGQRAGSAGGPSTVSVTKDDRTEAEKLVEQLGNDSFQDREVAEKALRAMGGKAYAAVRAGLRSKGPEIAQRCERLVPELRVAGLKEPDHPLARRYEKVVGKADEDHQLYLAAVSDPRRAEVLEAAELKPDSAGELYLKELNRAVQAMADGYQEAQKKYANRTGVILPTSGVPAGGEMVALMFLGTFPATSKVVPTSEHARLYFSVFSMGRTGDKGDPVSGFELGLGQGGGSISAPERRLRAAWLAARRESQGLHIGLRFAVYHEIAECLPAARTIAADKTLSEVDRAIALFVVGQGKDKADVALCEPLYKSEAVYHQTNYSDGKSQVAVVGQVRDIAVGVALILHGHEPADYDFDMIALYKFRGPELLKKYQFFSFRTDAGRKAAHEKAMAFLSKAQR